jgi:hypothetical protein
MNANPVVTVSQNLTAIGTMHAKLLTQAVHKANDPIMPGGLAMVSLAPAGSPDEWAELIAAAEFRHLAACTRADHGRCRYAEHARDEDNEESTLQTLRFWTERWRDYEFDRTPTVTTELGCIRGYLNWAWENDPAWGAFTEDIENAKTRLENILYAGERAERGVPCMYDECRGIRLIRKLVPTGDGAGNKVWKMSDWHCPRCKRTWSEDRYAAMVTAAHEASKFEDIDGETWCSIDYAARQVERSPKTVETWMLREKTPTVCIVSGRRVRFVHLETVRQLAAEAKKRKRAA